MTLRPDRYSRRGESGSQFLIAAKNPRIVLAPRVPVITRLGEFRVRHEMSLLRMREARERERERRKARSGDGQVAERSIIRRVAQLQFRERALFPPGFAAGFPFFPFLSFPSISRIRAEIRAPDPPGLALSFSF